MRIILYNFDLREDSKSKNIDDLKFTDFNVDRELIEKAAVVLYQDAYKTIELKCNEPEKITLNKRTEPPYPWNRVRKHWLHSERVSEPSIAEWLDGQWFCMGETKPVTPEEMAKRGWEWFAAAIPPKHPIYDCD